MEIPKKTDPMEIERPISGSPTASSPNPKADKIKELIFRYHAQLTRGCGRSNCTNIYCASCPGAKKYDAVEAAQEAIRIIKQHGEQYLHTEEVMKPRDGVSFAQIISTLEESKAANNFTPLVRKVGTLFASSELLNNSFLKDNGSLYDSSLGIDVAKLRETYNLIISSDKNVANALLGATERILPNLKRDAKGFTKREDLRQFIIILENPQVLNEEYQRTIFNPFCESLAALPSTSQQIIISYISSLTKDDFTKFLSSTQNNISLRFFQPPYMFSLHDDESIKASTKFLGLLYAANEIKKYVPYTDFYNDLINERTELKDEFLSWKASQDRGVTNNFAFSNFPFILKPEMKSKLLNIESIVSQRERRPDLLQLFMTGFAMPYLVLRIRRDHLIEDSLSELSRHPPEDLKKELKVHFVGEEAIDEGGVQKEWFQLIIREIFDIKYGMFTYNTETRNYWFNNNSTDFLEYSLIGNLLALAIYNGVILDVHFPHLVYKKLAGLKPNLEDLKQSNPSLAIGLEKLLKFEGNVEDTFERTFQISYEYFGEMRSYDLKPNGASIALTNENRQEYVDLYVKYLLEDSVQKQFDAFLKGFKMICDSAGFRMFRYEELELLICGSATLDFEALEKNTKYDNGFTKDHQTVKNFWSVVHSLTLDQKKKLLFFATGSDRSPIGGLGTLGFAVVRHGEDSDRLPSAHTCFNILLLPEYKTKEKLQERLLAAIDNAEGFGML